MGTRHICIVTTEYPPYAASGIATHVSQLVAGLLALGNQVTVLTYAPGHACVRRDGRYILLVADNPPDATCLSHFRRFYRVADHFAAVAANFLEQEGAPDVVHYHDWRAFGVAKALAERFRAAFIGSVHVLSATSWSWGFSASQHQLELETAMCQTPARVIAVSRYISDIMTDVLRVPRERIRIIPNGIEQSWLDEPPLELGGLEIRRRELAPDDHRIVMFSGRLSPEKGVLELLHSGFEVVQSMPKTVYVIAGGLHPQESYSQQIERLTSIGGLRDRVRLLGKLDRQQIRELYRLCDIAVVPSLWESFPYAAVEAMAAGVPVIVTDVGGLPEMVRDRSNGIVIETEVDSRGFRSIPTTELAAAQLQLLGDSQLRQTLGAAAKSFASRELTSEKMVRQAASVYDELMA